MKPPTTINRCTLPLRSDKGGSSSKGCALRRRELRWFHRHGSICSAERRRRHNVKRAPRNRWRVMVRQQQQARPRKMGIFIKKFSHHRVVDSLEELPLTAILPARENPFALGGVGVQKTRQGQVESSQGQRAYAWVRAMPRDRPESFGDLSLPYSKLTAGNHIGLDYCCSPRFCMS